MKHLLRALAVSALCALAPAGCASVSGEAAPALRDGRASIAAPIARDEAAREVEAFLKEKHVAFERADSPERSAFVAKAYRPETSVVRDALTANDERTLEVYVYPEGAAASEVRLSVIGTRFATGQGFAAFTSQRFHDAAAERALASELSERLHASVTEMPGEGDSTAR